MIFCPVSCFSCSEVRSPCLRVCVRVCVLCAVLRRPITGAASDEASDSEEELAAFCPPVSVSILSFICKF